MQSSVDWLVSKLPQRMLNYLKEEIEQAKAMEKQQIIDAYETSHISMMNSEQYYNETYGGGEQ